MVTLREIAEAEEKREDLEETYLRERGWQQTCETPGSLWVWTKTLPDGRVVLVGRTQALAFASALERMQAEAGQQENPDRPTRELGDEPPALARRILNLLTRRPNGLGIPNK
jgi:hypothetical protein